MAANIEVRMLVTEVRLNATDLTRTLRFEPQVCVENEPLWPGKPVGKIELVGVVGPEAGAVAIGDEYHIEIKPWVP